MRDLPKLQRGGRLYIAIGEPIGKRYGTTSMAPAPRRYGTWTAATGATISS